ncbi:MipA/OmpV family protein [Novosphingobium mangrovi (ex Hu et al. 2023)]|uniref:MipA/OmpV family protein n=1 Tax=Novosphingobium mangrovi (ex Hu et al. 2023) TaxID=2930094 RepID=A0ABT0AC98_9SPHN|nr:MipA/OmpV family protein [Novosphingobium mangrovi (ex Hu et al. 2023)]MCJ1960791.1 MipA/OmpV family protein [Novosphingobium mangrovi (ex Hu et al. 2023)]
MHKTIQAALLAASTLAAATASPAAFAQDTSTQMDEPGRNVFEGDSFTIGAGVVATPDYSGSDDYVIAPIPAIRGRIEGVTINTRAGGAAIDFIPDKRGAKIDLALGPVATVSFNRTRKVKDPVVAAAGRLKMPVEVGVSAGFTVNRVLHDYDWMTFNTDVKWDVAGAHDGMTVSPSVSYNTPLSKSLLVTVLAYARHVDDNFGDYNYSVSPVQSEASGLPQYTGKGGWDRAGVGTLVAWDLSGDLRDGGFSLIGVATYSRMLGDGKDTPYTSLRGSANQFMGGVGIAYTF